MLRSRYLLLILALPAALGLACGGRSVEGETGAAGASSGGASGKGGAPGRGGSSSKAGSGTGGAPAGCFYNDAYYPEGASFPAADGCNSCSCERGQVGCTEIGCAQQCYFNGFVYSPGDTFSAGDGCNSCTCNVSGEVLCTTIGCNNGCFELEAEYARTVDVAKTCNPTLSSLQCVALSYVGLVCGCSSFLNANNKSAINDLALISMKYAESGCANQPVLCGQCAAPSFGYCSPEGRCVDSWAVGPP